MNENIIIKNASTHNLKNVSLEIPKHRIVAFTGVSGSGKSSLVFDTIYTEDSHFKKVPWMTVIDPFTG